MEFTRKLLITGGAGFIGSHVLRLMVNKYPETLFVNLDKLTYAGNLGNLEDIQDKENYLFIKGDICDQELLKQLFEAHSIDGVIHLAAESHVDRSITNPLAFVETNVIGTANLLNVAKEHWKEDFSDKRFYHVSTDEVYGSLGMEGFFYEDTSYDPRSPYSASKASSDHFVRAFHHTYGMPIVISNCSNNYGPNHFPEKLIPLLINNILNDKALPIYGKGENVRDWLYVVDHALAIDKVFHEGIAGETYNIGGHNEWSNIDLVRLLCDKMDEKLERDVGTAQKLITFVTDRAGHDLRYAIDASKIEKDLDWKPSVTFEEGLAKTIDWYFDNKDWLEQVTSGNYATYYEKMYS